MNERIKVLVVDDSAFVTTAVSRKLEADPEIEVVGVARDGMEAVEKVKSLKPNVVTMDVVMPRMDGLTALGQIMSECPTPVVMLSALTDEGAESTIKALQLGAVDFFLKASALSPSGDDSATGELINKIKLAARAYVPGSKAAAPTQKKERIKVLVVDDSAFVTTSISKRLEADPDIEVVGVARDGAEAVAKVKSLSPAVVTLDIVMPGMDGLAALEQIMAECPTPVVMLSALTADGTEATIRALELGAVDFFLKVSALTPTGNDGAGTALIDKIKLAAKVKISRPKTAAGARADQLQKARASGARHASMDSVLVIGSSTGGPKALMQVIPALPDDIPAPILVVQHMPPVFTRSLAERLNQASELEVKEAEEGDSIRPGRALIAPGDFHMTVAKGDEIRLNQQPAVCGVRPSVDVLMESVAKVYGASSLGVVLTGMGTDGTRGASLIKAVGGKILAEAESTCAVYGMPMSVAKAGYADKVVPVHRMASEIMKMCQEKRGT